MNIKRKNRYTPNLPENSINKIVKELSNPELLPTSYSTNQTRKITDKVAEVTNKLIVEYNHQVIKIIENERKEAFKRGIETGKSMLKAKA